ncbi:Uncharacterised protein [Chlamydia abortus]|nr:Uncharacterised protein [Chlamydia abortus]
MIPPRASISRTMCPFPIPPTAGLQLNLAIVSKFEDKMSTEAPIFAEQNAASQPACPAPTTMTS